MTDHRPEHPVLSVLNGTVRILLGTLLVGLVGSRIAAHYADVRTAAELKDDLGTQVLRLTATETESLTVLAFDLSPQSYLVRRCDAGDIPDVLSAQARSTACDNAIVQSMLDEQKLNNEIRAGRSEGTVLERRLEKRLTGGVDDDYAELRSSLDILRKLNSSTTCNAERADLVATLQTRYSWIDSQTRTALVGPSTTGTSCDDHGEDYPDAAIFLADGLKFQSDVVASHIEAASVEGLEDTRSELLRGLVSDWIVLVLVGLGLAFLLVTSIVKRRVGATLPSKT